MIAQRRPGRRIEKQRRRLVQPFVITRARFQRRKRFGRSRLRIVPSAVKLKIVSAARNHRVVVTIQNVLHPRKSRPPVNRRQQVRIPNPRREFLVLDLVAHSQLPIAPEFVTHIHPAADLPVAVFRNQLVLLVRIKWRIVRKRPRRNKPPAARF